ncbi:vWA domain-containing protein [Marininema halotolerans]|uniref:D-amino-acid dehydrogenase/Ca-activated chloride channel family protein n=1 Tax=Marininema halotolerans TaxID=1155944 RepID=A0A1I6T9B7_9BACL|nr:VWA domain-containing protein [Marininema halotolerans]SFS85835.1 D-amino-acid dehydrogenase/Ca-activated chloride channel family protein [Marininema halotolerans]
MKKIIIWALILTFIISGCGKPTAEPAKTDEAKKKKPFQPATKVEGMLREGPGKYAGDHYDEDKVNQALNKLPDDLTGDQAYSHIVQLLAEDYGPLVDKYDSFDPSIKVDLDTPEGKKAAQAGKHLNVAILLDASGSMAEKISGGKKMDLAKEAIRGFVSQLPSSAQVSLRVYGYKGSNSTADKKESCASNQVMYPLAKPDSDRLEKAMASVKPAGWTPIAEAIKAAKSDLASQGQGSENVVYVVSDGKETCGGDPVSVAQSLHESNVKAVVNIIGLDVNDAEQQGLKAVAEAGGGEYTAVQTKEELEQQFKAERQRLEIAWKNWGARTNIKIGQIWAEKQEAVWNVESNIRSLNGQENKQMVSAMNYLNENNKLEDGDYGDEYDILYKKIELERWRMIGDYNEDRSTKISDLLEEEEGKKKGATEQKEEDGLNSMD